MVMHRIPAFLDDAEAVNRPIFVETVWRFDMSQWTSIPAASTLYPRLTIYPKEDGRVTACLPTLKGRLVADLSLSAPDESSIELHGPMPNKFSGGFGLSGRYRSIHISSARGRVMLCSSSGYWKADRGRSSGMTGRQFDIAAVTRATHFDFDEHSGRIIVATGRNSIVVMDCVTELDESVAL